MTIAAAQPIYQVITGQALPDTGLFVRSGGVLLTGLNSGYTFSLRVRNPNDDATLFTKTTGFTGQIGSGSEPGGVPNLVIAPGEFRIASRPCIVWHCGKILECFR